MFSVPYGLFRLYCCLELARLSANAALFAGASLLASPIDDVAVAVSVAVDVVAGSAAKASAVSQINIVVVVVFHSALIFLIVVHKVRFIYIVGLLYT